MPTVWQTLTKGKEEVQVLQAESTARLCPQWRSAGAHVAAAERRKEAGGEIRGTSLALLLSLPQGVWGKMAVAKKGSIDSYCIGRASHPSSEAQEGSRTTRLVPGSRPCHLGVSFHTQSHPFS